MKIKATDEWEGHIRRHTDKLVTLQYVDMLKNEGKLHLKLFKHIERCLDTPRRDTIWSNGEEYIYIKMVRLA